MFQMMLGGRPTSKHEEVAGVLMAVGLKSLLPQMKGLSSKIYAAFLLAALIPTSVAGLVGVYFSLDTLKRETLTHLEQEVTGRSEGIARFFGQLSSELLYIASSSAIAELAQAKMDESEELKALRARLVRDFSAVAFAYPHIYQIRYVDVSGREIVRVDRRGGQVYVVPEIELQDKSRRYYIDEILLLNPREIYVSPLDLNVENERPESPEKPVIRFGTQITDERGTIRGMLIINLHAAVLLDPIEKMVEARGGIAYLLDRAGFFLSRSADRNPDRPFEMKSLEVLIETYQRSMLSRILDGKRGTETLDEWIVAYAPVDFRGADLVDLQGVGAQGWRIVVALPRKQLFAAAFNLYFLYGVLALSLAVTALAGFLSSRHLLKPLVLLQVESEAIAKKNFTRRVQIKGTDEIAELGHRFNAMAAELERYYASLEGQRQRLKQEVRARTAALEHERTNLATIIDNTADGIVSLSRAGLIKLANAAAVRLLAEGSCDLVGRNFSDFSPGWVEHAQGANDRKLGSGFYDLRRGDKTLAVNIAPVARDGVCRGYIVVAREVSEERRLQEERRELDRQMFQMEKMTTIGELSMGLAHEIGNPLAGMKTVIQVLLDEESDIVQMKSYLLRFESEIDRLSDFLRTFHGFVTPQEIYPIPCCLEEVLDDVLLWTRREATARGIEIELKKNGQVGATLWADPNLLKQLLLNLIINAIHAIPEKGHIIISTGVPMTARPWSDDLARMRFSVEDNGVGIRTEILPRIFDPFFTTRRNGSGLGLAIVKKIAAQHGADIVVESEVGKGTRFEIAWPTGGPVNMDGTVAKVATHSVRATVMENA